MFQKMKKSGFRSEIDSFFHEFDKKREMSKSREKEVEKHEALFYKRDNAVEEKPSEIWKEF